MSQLARLGEEEDGQALIWGAGVIVLIVALFYGAIDIGQLVLGKIEAQNAADAAAMTAAAIKASMHNTRSLAYRAASGQLELSRLQMVRATGLALREIGQPNRSAKDYAEAIKLATAHRKKLEELREGIVQFNEFATGTKAGPQATRDAAEAMYRANLGTLAIEVPTNLRLVESSGSFPEMDGGFANSVSFKSEAMNATGKAGKSAVVVEPQVGAYGGGLLGYGARAQLSAAAVAGQVEAHQQYGKNLHGIDDYGVEWYTTRLFPVGKGTLGQK